MLNVNAAFISTHSKTFKKLLCDLTFQRRHYTQSKSVPANRVCLFFSSYFVFLMKA